MTTKCTRCANDAHSGLLCGPCALDKEIQDSGAMRYEKQGTSPTEPTMSQKYPKYYKKIPAGVTEADTYLVNMLFPVIEDTSGCVLHARKKLLVPGSRTGGKAFYDDIKEARDTLTRWLELHKDWDFQATMEQAKQDMMRQDAEAHRQIAKSMSYAHNMIRGTGRKD